MYIVMGYSSYLIYKDIETFPVQSKKALMVYAGHLILNFTWTPVFFGFQQLGLSCVNILGLDAALVWTMFEFYKVNPTAAYLNVPYLLWAVYASSVNIGTWWLNRKEIPSGGESRTEKKKA